MDIKLSEKRWRKKMNIIKIQCTKFSKNSKKFKVMTNGIQ